eukprot:01440.XXX_943_5435_1 [CDS] Oithona nana genome sequencing.
MPILQSCYCCCSSARQLAIAGGVFSLVMSSIYTVSIFYQLMYDEKSHLFIRSTTTPPSSSVLQSRLASTSRAEGDTFTSNDVTANDNHQLLVGSIINPRGFSKEDIFYVNIIKLGCDISVLVSIPLLFVGIAQIRRVMLVPWVVSSILQSAANLIEAIYLLGLNTTRFEPTTAFIFTTTFFLLFAHVYSILGVISLYQEYQDGIHDPNTSTGGIQIFEMGHVSVFCATF